MRLRSNAAAAAFMVVFAGILRAQTAPTPVAPFTINAGDTVRFTSVTAGGGHSCGLTADGKAYCWGKNNAGQLGDSTTADRAMPVPVAGGFTFRLLTAGGHHTCGITTDDDPYCWGGNEHGQLGNGGRDNMTYPFRVGGDLRATTISAGREHTCATQIHWDKQDRMVCWGSNQSGQLGDMSEDDASSPIDAFGVIRYVSVATGDQHTCGATKQGKVFCWGGNARGQLGNASATLSRVPFPIRMNRRVNINKVVAGAAHSCALTDQGEAICWGENTSGQVGNGRGGRVLSPAGLRDSLGFTAISAGGDETCGLRQDGTASCWGSNASGVLGSDVTAGSRVPAPALGGAALTMLSLGSGRGCAIRADGTTVCWGGPARGPGAAP
jgi:alpha-tubulin suppressor-like RCC1 family protein